MIFSSHSKDKVNLLVSVQSSIVRASLVRIKDGTAPNIFFNHNEIIPHRAHLGTAHLIKMTLKAVREAIAIAARELHTISGKEADLGRSITEIHFVLSSPWIVSHARTMSQIFARPNVVTKKLIVDIIGGERTQYIGNNSENLEIVEEKIFDVRLNGYSVDIWEGKLAESLEISFASSVAGAGMIERFRDVSTHLVHSRSIGFHSSLLLQHIGVQHVLRDKSSYILIHAHGELTDVVIVENRMCVFFGSFPRGINTIIRSIAHATRTTDQMADSILTLHTGGHTDSLQNLTADKVIKEMADGWIGEFVKLLRQSDYTNRLPDTTIISARIHEDFFIRSFRQKYQNANIEPMTIDLFAPHVSYGNKVEHLRLLGLYTIALGLMDSQ